MVSLATANGWIRRMDLATELLSAFALGWLISRIGMPPSLAVMATVALAMAPLQLAAIFRIARLAPQAMLHGREEMGAALIKPPDWRAFVQRVGQWQQWQQPARPLLRAQLRENAAALLGSWRIYFSQPILPSSIAFVLLFANVMLSPGEQSAGGTSVTGAAPAGPKKCCAPIHLAHPGNLIVALLDSHGFNNSAHACFRAGCATMGFVGTWLARRLIRHLGLLRAGCLALLLQLVTLGAAASIFAACMQPATLLISGGQAAAAGPMLGSVPLAAAAFAACVVLSRAGAWVMDLVNSQLFQQTVPQHEMASASSESGAACLAGPVGQGLLSLPPPQQLAARPTLAPMPVLDPVQAPKWPCVLRRSLPCWHLLPPLLALPPIRSSYMAPWQPWH